MLRLLIAGLALALCCAAEPSTVPSFSASGIDDAMDLHGDLRNARLVLFIGGNEWMAMPAIVDAFVRQHPDAAPVFYETLPPGILADQLAAGSLRIGTLTISVPADVFMAGKRRMAGVVQAGLAREPSTFATNVLAILVHRGNPKLVSGLTDLGNADVRVAMPNPVYEGIARQIELALRKAGGSRLVDAVMVTKVHDGSTQLTQIHHRQTPLWIVQRRVDAGPLWLTEALYQERIGAPVTTIRIPPAHNVTATYQAAVVTHAPHARLAGEFVRFLESSQARDIFRSYGFGSPSGSPEEE
ncbi:MAG TPA: substrate-binding domain-containing protein [Candidatus Baltobacteraceae bacterium]|nr:substrate-binding domain-containing protein [Candidatus Baltobacteraceae bacterium]